MNFSSSWMFAKSLIFPKTQKNSSARKSIIGAVICIGLSIIPLICVISITDGMIDGMTQRIIGLSSGHLQAYVASSIESVKNPEAFLEYSNEILQIDGVKKVFPEVSINALGAGKISRSGIQIRGVVNNIFEKNESFKKLFNVIEGDLHDFGNEKSVVIGKKLSEDLDLKSGDTLKVITTKSTGSLISPKLSVFKIIAVVSSGYQELDQFWCFIPIESAYKYLSLENSSYNIMIETDDAFSPALVSLQYEIKDHFGSYANVYRWDQIHSAEFENFSSTKVMLVFIMLLIVLVASVNISSAVIMLVMERKKEIAILKSIGSTPGEITLSFVMAGIFCGLGGLAIGIPLGILFTIFSNQIIKGLEWLINIVTNLFTKTDVVLLDPAYYLTEIPVKIPWMAVVTVIFGVIMLSVIVTILPAKKAGKEKPLDILRKN